MKISHQNFINKWCFIYFGWMVFIIFDFKNSMFQCHGAPKRQKHSFIDVLFSKCVFFFLRREQLWIKSMNLKLSLLIINSLGICFLLRHLSKSKEIGCLLINNEIPHFSMFLKKNLHLVMYSWFNLKTNSATQIYSLFRDFP